jgi:hypothetical protein
VLTLFPPTADVRAAAPWDGWSLLVASLATVVAFLLLLDTLVRATAVPVVVPTDAVTTERVTFVTPRPPSVEIPASLRSRGPASARSTAPLPAVPAPSRDTAASSPSAPPGPGVRHVPAAAAVVTVGAPSSRLMPSRSGASLVPAPGFDPFRERAAPSPEMRDSLLRDMRDTIAIVARTLVMTGAQRDALIKEGMLRNKVSGRTLLDPGVGNGTYRGGAGGIPLPFLEPGPSRGQRVRDSISFAENRARLQRLRARADSLRAARPIS